MSTAYVIVIVLAATANLAAAIIDFLRPPWLMANMTRAGVPPSWVFPLGVLKLAGALGLLVGFVVPLLGVAAAVGLVLYFVGAVAAIVRARDWVWVPSPATYLLLAVGALAVQLTAA